jgi:hypothetical protein
MLYYSLAQSPYLAFSTFCIFFKRTQCFGSRLCFHLQVKKHITCGLLNILTHWVKEDGQSPKKGDCVSRQKYAHIDQRAALVKFPHLFYVNVAGNFHALAVLPVKYFTTQTYIGYGVINLNE